MGDIGIVRLTWSLVAFSVIVAAHVTSFQAVSSLVRQKPRGHLKGRGFLGELPFLLVFVASLLLIHLGTNLLWGAYIWYSGAVVTFKDAVFYSFENYTSLGLTRINVDADWRMLAPLISMSGIFCFGWSTAVLVSLFGHVYATNS